MIDSAGFAYVSDPGNQRIQRWQIVSDPLGTIQSATFIGWIGRCTSGTNCDVANERSNGATCTAATCSAASQGSAAGQFINPDGMGLDGAGNLYVADSINNRIQEFGNTGTFIRQWGTRGMLPGEFRTPVDVAVSPVGDVFVADSRNERVQRFAQNGTVLASFGGSIAIAASLGFPPRSIDALVDPNPMFLFPGQTTSTTVQVTSISAFQGPVDLATTGCCEDLLTRAFIANAVTTSFAPTPVAVPPNGTVNSTLSVTAPMTAAPEKLVVPLFASNTQLGVGTAAGLVVEILPPIPPDLGTASACVGGTVVGSIGGTSPGTGPEVLPLSAVTRTLYSVKAGAPSRTSFMIGARDTRSLAGWTITIAKSTVPLRSDQAVVILTNTTSWDKGMTTVNSANCVAAGQFTRLSTGQTGSFLISKADTSTILLNRAYCRSHFIWCWDSGGWDQFAIFDEAAFWNLFGGRQVTISWFFSTGE